MTLRKKTLIVVGAILIGLIAILFGVSQSIMINSFAKLEEQDTSKNVERALGALSDNISNLNAVVGDWAPWDDTYAFVEDINNSYIENNLNDDTFANLRVNLMLFINSSGHIVFGKAFDLHNKQEVPVPESLEESLSASNLLTHHPDADSKVSGLLLLPEGPMLIASQPILTSQNQGPIRGTLIMGRYLDSAEIGSLADITQLSLTVQRLDEPQIPPDFEKARSVLSEGKPIFVRAMDKESIAGYALLSDVYGAPVLILRTDMQRTVYQQGQHSLIYFMFLLVTVGVVSAIVVLLLLEKLVLSPLSRLSTSVSAVGVSSDLSLRVPVTGKDELSSLGGEINKMLEALALGQEKQHESDLAAVTVIEGMIDGVILVDVNGKITYVNKAFEKLLGYKADEVVETSALELPTYRDSRDRDTAREALKKAIGKGISRPVDMIAISKDGEEIPISFVASVIRDAQDKPKGLVAVVRDVTERRWAEEELKRSEKRFRSLIENAQDAIVVIAEDGTIRYASSSIERTIGYTSEEVMGGDGFGFVHPDEMSKVGKAFTDLMERPENVVRVELRARHKDGSWLTVEALAKNLLDDEAVEGIIVNWRDVTERKEAEEALRRSELNYRELFDSTLDGLFVIDAETMRVILANEAGIRMAKMFGFNSPIDVNIADIAELFHPNDRDRVIKTIAEDMFEKDLRQINEFRMSTKDGREMWISAVGTRTKYEGKLAGLVSMRDISERRKMEEEVRCLSDAVKMSNDSIVITDAEGRIIEANEATLKVLGIENRADLVGREALEAVAPEDREMAFEKVIKALAAGGRISVEYHCIANDGRKLLVEASISVMKDENGETIGYMVVSRDITERRNAEEEKQRMEEQLLLAGRLAAVGELAAGVAHELNNPLTAIQGFAQLLTARDDLDETMKNDLGIVYRESQRAAKITQNLLSFARKHEPEKQLISLNEVVEKTLELRAHQMKVNNIELVVDFAPDLPKTMADFFQMQQVFVNLVNNAEQAMVEAHGKGRLVVKTQKVGDMIQISFADNGPGIPEENMKRIFDPFFTTKELRKGTGLGLSICYGLVEAHGGRIYARSKVGEGATFVVEIPIVLENQ